MKKTNSKFIKLTNLLSDGQFHDGTTLGEALNTTRSAIWKSIKKLQAYGIKVNSIKGKGYSLFEPLILIDPNKINRGIDRKNIKLHCFESLESTNDYLKKLPANSKINVCFTEQQTAGRGRMNREWHSPFAHNIYFSCAYPFRKDISELSGLSLVVSLAIVDTLEAFQLPDRLLIKWPNDIIYQQKKLSGNLIEIQAESHGVCQAIIGIGINVNMLNDVDDAITQAWTSLRKICSTYVDRNQLAILLINNLIDYLQKFEEKGLSAFNNQWQDLDYLFNKDITLKNGGNKIVGKAIGINQQGHLIVKTEDGAIQYFSSGDTSISK